MRRQLSTKRIDTAYLRIEPGGSSSRDIELVIRNSSGCSVGSHRVASIQNDVIIGFRFTTQNYCLSQEQDVDLRLLHYSSMR